MSFGLEIDILAVAGLVKQIRKSFVGAPEQFKAISDDVRAFSIVLQDIEVNWTELSLEQSQEYQSVVTSCKHLLMQLKRTLEEYSGVAKGDKTGKRASIKRVWKRLKWEPDDIRDIRSQISVKIDTLRSLDDQITSRNIVRLIGHQEETEREATIKWVSDINYVAQQNDIFLRCQTGSRRWLFESEVYLEWCKKTGGLLFCPGNAGTGKTFTTAMVIESLRLANDAESLTAYMYCSYQNHTQTIEKLLCSLLRVALEEADNEADGAVSTCRQLRLSNKIISRQHCLSLLQDVFSRFTRVNLIVDALDELTNEVRRPLIHDLLKLYELRNVNLFVTSRGIPEIQHLFETCKAYTSLEVRSSDEDIRNFLCGNTFQLPNFVTRSQKLQDEVIDSITNASAGMFLLAELYLKSLATIISVGSLRMRLSNLATGSNAYDSLYEDSMLRIGFQGPELEHIAVQMLLVLTCARRPLSPLELSHALSIDESSDNFDEDMIPDMDDLVAACTGLAVLDATSNVVHLVHKSAAEYLERTRSRWFPRANEKMAFMCLRYLQIAKAKPEETKGEEAPFLHYAKANWSYHSIEAEKEAADDTATGDASRTNSATESGTSPNKFAVTQLAIQQMTKEVVDVESSIIEACHAGHQAWVEQLIVVRNYDMNKHGISQETFISDESLRKKPLSNTSFRDNILLTIAAARGDHSMAQMLLAQGADPNIFNAVGQTPLMIAVTNGFDYLVSLLLDQRSTKPDLMCRYSGGLSTALLASIELGREGCFKMLVEKSNRRARDSQKRGVIWLAATSGHTSIISELLRWSDVEIDYTAPGFCGSSLTAAIRGKHEEAALLLLPYSNCQSCSHCGVTPMHHAVRNKLYNLLKRLLEHDASAVDNELYGYHQGKHLRGRRFLIGCERGTTEHTRTPLMTAIYLKDLQATQLLLPYADVNQGLTWRPLHQATESGNVEIFELLLKQANIEPDPVDRRGITPFLLAAERGNCDIMKALIKKGGVKFNRRDSRGYSPRDYIIHRHFRNPHYFRVLTSGLDIDVNEKDSSGSSLLHKACCLFPEASFETRGMKAINWNTSRVGLLENNSGPLVAELLKRPRVDVNALDKEGKAPLLLAVKSHQRDVVSLLLEREDIDVLVRDEAGNDALLLASLYEPIFKKQYPRLASSMNRHLPPLRDQISTQYEVGYRPEILNAKFKEYNESIFLMLIQDRRINLYCRNYQGKSIMVGVAITGTKSMVKAVLDTTELALDLNTIYCDGRSLILIALQENQDDDAVDLLIAHCPAAILQRVDKKDRTPLSYAVQRATSQATRSLLATGIDAKVMDRSGRTCLSYAAERGHPDTARLLNAADDTLINIPDSSGFTPLMYASYALNVRVMSVFLEWPNIDILALDLHEHSFLCHLMRPYHPKISGEGSGKGSATELDALILRIRHLLQLHVHAVTVKAQIHSPFICAMQNYYPGFATIRRNGYDVDEWKEKFDGYIRKLQRYDILLDYFHPGLNFWQCTTTDGLFEILGEERGDDSDDEDDQDLWLRALRLYVNRNT